MAMQREKGAWGYLRFEAWRCRDWDVWDCVGRLKKSYTVEKTRRILPINGIAYNLLDVGSRGGLDEPGSA